MERLQWMDRGPVDEFIGIDEVPLGPPFPYMISLLKERFLLGEEDLVIKVGSTPRDIEEGINAGCAYVILVTAGWSGIEEVTDSRPTHTVSRLLQIAVIIKQPFAIEA